MKRNATVTAAVGAALKKRGLTHQDVATILGKAKSTISNKIWSGRFSKKEASLWSKELSIPIDVFSVQEDLSLDELRALAEVLIREVSKLKDRVSELEKRMSIS